MNSGGIVVTYLVVVTTVGSLPRETLLLTAVTVYERRGEVWFRWSGT